MSFKINYGYDRASNRTWDENTVQAGSSKVYTYDSLHRLSQYKAGVLNTNKDDTTSLWSGGAQKWTLDPVGNQTAVDAYRLGIADASGIQRLVELGGQHPQQGQRVCRPHRARNLGRIPNAGDGFSSDTSAQWEKIGGAGDTFDVNSTEAGSLTVSAVSRDTFDGGLQDPEACTILLLKANIGPAQVSLNFDTSGFASGQQAGLVFGYKSPSSYWLRVQEPYSYNSSCTKSLAEPRRCGRLPAAQAYMIWQSAPEGNPINWTCSPVTSLPMASRPDGWACTQIRLVRSSIGRSVMKMRTRAPRVSGGSATQRRGDPGGVGQPGRRHRRCAEAGWRSSKQAAAAQRFTSQALSEYVLDSLVPRSGRCGDVSLIFDAVTRIILIAFQIIRDYMMPFMVSGYAIRDGHLPLGVSGTPGTGVWPVNATKSWVRVTSDGTTVAVKLIVNQQHAHRYRLVQRRYGLVQLQLQSQRRHDGLSFSYRDITDAEIDDLTIKSDTDANGSYETTEHIDRFTADASGFVPQGPEYDLAGNLTYDGVYAYSYDAWNRLVKVSKAFKEGTDNSGDVTLGSLQTGSVVATMTYDGRGRRISKAVGNSGYLDCTYHYYYDGRRDRRGAQRLGPDAQAAGLGHRIHR